ncbi:MAG: EVE domain-containing protein [Runella slithyformis]|nr:MAG: EVE domain-containing protein [Runella slithyformis]
MNHWLVKSEPFVYSYDDLQRDGRGTWDGVRNYQARNNLQAMRLNDLVLFYHSNEPDPTTDDARWVVVDLAPVLRLDRPVTLAQIKTDNRLNEIALIKQSRLSVMPIKPQEFDLILSLGTHENN